eukprot:scaffold96661_cov29-Tisochrysis_lutea.AAC.1
MMLSARGAHASPRLGIRISAWNNFSGHPTPTEVLTSIVFRARGAICPWSVRPEISIGSEKSSSEWTGADRRCLAERGLAAAGIQSDARCRARSVGELPLLPSASLSLQPKLVFLFVGLPLSAWWWPGGRNDVLLGSRQGRGYIIIAGGERVARGG